jgi:hypothetical protein
VRDAVIEAGERVIEGQAGVAAQSEDMRDSMRGQQSDQPFRAIGSIADKT